MYLPKLASELAWALAKRAFWAAGMFSACSSSSSSSSVCMCILMKGTTGCMYVLVVYLSAPCLEGGLLESASVGEGDGPGALSLDQVHRVQVDGRLLLG